MKLLGSAAAARNRLAIATHDNPTPRRRAAAPHERLARCVKGAWEVHRWSYVGSGVPQRRKKHCLRPLNHSWGSKGGGGGGLTWQVSTFVLACME